jgi:hypothetical protein
VLVVPSNRRPDRIEVDPLDEQYTRVRLLVGRLDVTSSVANFAWHESVGRSLAKWFRELDDGWRGWEGSHDWRSMEGELRLSAVHNGLGTVTLTARLSPSPEHWSATGELELDAGGFGALSALAASFP